MVADQEDKDNTHAHVVLTKGMMVLHYRIIEKIGPGDTGEVFVKEINLKRPVIRKEKQSWLR